ncbi:hypothetical protein T05_16190 [Trichinella murrelli]|uniref:Uncharacterized protein n=1 Tax=Trichinella murrelli TaxID=144512 RepID=A0A0V0U356_9BILA|nr:hypothetical protein T05_16190 [Trichinella murrelli]
MYDYVYGEIENDEFECLGASTADGNEHIDLVVLAYRISVFHYIGVAPTLAFCGAQIRMLVDVIYGIP